ncbi:glycosyltransferase, partial [Acinetobacter baumannii]
QPVTVVCTGSTNDSRDENHFPAILEKISTRLIRDHVVILGLVPRDDVLALMQEAICVLQPSLYEGWSTSVEEAKALGLPLVISDIP